MKKKILIVGPGTKTSKGGIAAVTKQMLESEELKNAAEITEYSSYKDSNKIACLLYGIAKIILFPFYAVHKDVIHIQMTSKGSMVRKSNYVKIAKKMNKKIIVQIHCCDYFLDCMDKKQKEKAKEVLKMADKVLVLSEKFADRIRKELGLTNVEMLPNGIDPDEYIYEKSKNDAIVYLGKLTRQKGCFDILEALKHLKEKYGLQPECVFAGNGAGEEELKKKTKEYGLSKVIFLGWVEGEEKKSLLKGSGIMLLPSYHEGFPVSILEGMVSGCYIIASDVGACADMAEGEFINAGDADFLGKKIKDVLCMSHEEYENTLQKNREKSETEYNIHNIHSRLSNIYKDICCS